MQTASLSSGGSPGVMPPPLAEAMPALTQAAFSVAAGGAVYAAVLWSFFRRRVLAVVDFLRLIRLCQSSKIGHWQVELAWQVDPLHSPAFVHLKASAENLVPLQQLVEAAA